MVDVAIDAYLAGGGNLEDVVKALEWRARALRNAKWMVVTGLGYANQR